MSDAKIVTGFSRLSDANLGMKAQVIITGMTGNANFTTPAPTPAITAITTAKTAFDVAVVAAQSGDKLKIATKNEKRQALILLLTQLAHYVEMVANGNRTMMMSSGFDLSRSRSAVVLGMVLNFTLVEGAQAGQLLSCCDSVEGAVSYVHQYTTAEPTEQTVWHSEPDSSCEHTFMRLESGRRYWCRIVAVGSHSQSVASSVLSHIAQ